MDFTLELGAKDLHPQYSVCVYVSHYTRGPGGPSEPPEPLPLSFPRPDICPLHAAVCARRLVVGHDDVVHIRGGRAEACGERDEMARREHL